MSDPTPAKKKVYVGTTVVSDIVAFPNMKRIIPLLLFIAAPAVASADGWVYSVPDGNQWWDQGILEWTDPSGFHNVVSNIARSGTSLSIGNNGSCSTRTKRSSS